MNIEEIKTGDILLSSSRSILARAIQFFQGNKKIAKYNHAMIAYRDVNNILYVFEAEKKGIQQTKFIDGYINKSKYTDIIGFHPKFVVDEGKMVEFMKKYVNKTKYDYLNLLVYQPVKILTFGKIWLGEKKEDERAFICSEWVAFVYNKTTIYSFKKQLSMIPVDFFEHLSFFEKYLIKP